MMSPDLNASSGALNIPPPTAASTASSDQGKRSGQVRSSKEGHLPTIGGAKTGRSKAAAHHDTSDDEHGSSLPHIGGGGGGQSDGSDAEHNLPPITVNRVGRQQRGTGYSGHASGHSNYSYASGKSKQRSSVANKPRGGAMSKYKKYSNY